MKPSDPSSAGCTAVGVRGVPPSRRAVLLSFLGAPVIACPGSAEEAARAGTGAPADRPTAHVRRYYELARY